MIQTDQIIEGLTAMGAPVNEDTRTTLDAWRDGRELASLLSTNGWEVVQRIIVALVSKEMSRLLDLPVGDPSIVAAHAGASAVTRFVNDLSGQIQVLVLESEQKPEILKKGIAAARQIVGTEPLPGL